MAALTNKQRFILNTFLSLVAILLGVGLLVAFINTINQGTCELFRAMLSTAVITVSLTTFLSLHWIGTASITNITLNTIERTSTQTKIQAHYIVSFFIAHNYLHQTTTNKKNR